MSEVGVGGDDGFFQPRAGASSAGDVDPDAVGTNAIRALILGMLLSDAQGALYGLDAELEAVGATRETPAVTGWEARLETSDQSDSVLRQFDADAPETEWRSIGSERPYLEQRAALWERAATSPDAADAIAWLRMVMASGPGTVDGVAAAAALSHWRRPSKGARVPRFLDDARDLLRVAAEANEPVVSEIALAARGTGLGRRRDANREGDLPNGWKLLEPAADGISTMVHGTWAWRGNWWYPSGDFHEYVLDGIRPNTYSGGAPFSWSGAYLSRSRRTAASRLARWVGDMAGGSVDTVFSHSYGGGITLESTTFGARFETAVMLSVPVHRNYDIEWRHIQRPLSVRLNFDLVLAAARARQRFPANVDELVLPLYPWRHGATHEPALWAANDIASKLGL